MNKVIKWVLVIVGAIVAVIVGFLLLFIMVIWCNSPGKIRPLKNESGAVIENSISEKVWVEIGGIPQGMFIRGENPDNPVILFLHGGPGSPELPLIEATEKSERLEKYFTVCYWNQRGAGMTYRKNTPVESMNGAQFVEDARQVTEYLRERFGQEKIFLMGHSWGSYLGVKTAQQYPELYYAYMGIGQVTDQKLSEQLAYSYMIDHAATINDTKGIKKLSMFDPQAVDFPQMNYLLGPRSKYMNKYGIGITHDAYSMNEHVGNILFFKGYTFREKVRYANGTLFSLENTFYEVIDDNLFETSTSFAVPIYVLHGVYDYQVSYSLAEGWINYISAPVKGLYAFENSAHSPNMEEPELFVEVVRDIADIYIDK